MPDDQGALDVSPQDFARLVHGAGDEEIRAMVHGLSTEAILDRQPVGRRRCVSSFFEPRQP